MPCPYCMRIGRYPRDEGVGLRGMRPCVHGFAECTGRITVVLTHPGVPDLVQFACPAWKTDEFKQRTGEDPVLLHFVTDKPWGSKNWPDFDQWRGTARELMDELPECAKFFSASVRGSDSRSRAAAAAAAAGSVPKPQSGAGEAAPWRPRWKQEGRGGDDRDRGAADGRGRGGQHHSGAPGRGRPMYGRHHEQGPRDNRHISSRDHGSDGHGMGHPPPRRADADRW